MIVTPRTANKIMIHTTPPETPPITPPLPAFFRGAKVKRGRAAKIESIIHNICKGDT